MATPVGPGEDAASSTHLRASHCPLTLRCSQAGSKHRRRSDSVGAPLRRRCFWRIPAVSSEAQPRRSRLGAIVGVGPRGASLTTTSAREVGPPASPPPPRRYQHWLRRSLRLTPGFVAKHPSDRARFTTRKQASGSGSRGPEFRAKLVACRSSSAVRSSFSRASATRGRALSVAVRDVVAWRQLRCPTAVAVAS